MTNKNIIGVILLVIIGFSLIIIFPIPLLLIKLSSYNIIDASPSYYFHPSSPLSVERLSLNVDFGDIEIRYIEPSVDYFAKIEVSIEMTGVNPAGKQYSDYFDIEWINTSSPVNFTMRFKSDIERSEILELINNVKIVVILKADIIFDISAYLEEGNINFISKFMVTVNNLDINITKGDIFYDLNHCILQGNISGITEKGNLKLIVYNILNIQDVIWDLTTPDGGMDIKIFQEIEMGANISGSIIINSLNLTYVDKNVNIGAIFTFLDRNWRDWGNIKIRFDVDPILEGGFHLVSTDFPAKNNFDLLFTCSSYLKIDVRNNYS